MKNFSLLLAVMGLISVSAFTQEEIHLKSDPKPFNPIKKEILTKLPPNLAIKKWECNEPSGDKIIEGGEIAVLKLTLVNNGKGEAQAMKLKITDEINDPAFSFEHTKDIERLLPEQSMDILIPITTDVNLKRNKHVLKITLDEGNGYNMNPPVEIVLNTIEYRKPQLSYTGYEVCDTCKGANAIVADNTLQPGEMVKVRMFIQNNGLNTARSVNYLVLSGNQNVSLKENSGNMGDVAIGENKSIALYVNPNKKYKDLEVPLSVSLQPTNNYGSLDKFEVQLPVNQQKSEQVIAEVKTDNSIPEKPILEAGVTASVITNLKNIEQAPFSKTKRYSYAAAIVIGIENYIDLPRVIYAENDAKVITNYFTNTLGISSVETYNSIKASHLLYDKIFNLEDGLLKTKMIVEDKTDLFIFFSGYGLASPDGEQIFLMPSDGEKDRLSSTGWNVTALFETLKHMGARNIILFLDAGFSGISRQSETIKPDNLIGTEALKTGAQSKDPWIDNPAFFVFNSTLSNGPSFAYDQSKTSLFTYYLCLGLQGEADANNDRKITTGELSQYLQR